MWGLMCILSTMVYVALGAPQAVANPPAQILTQTAVVNADGSFNHSFEADNGIKIQESGYVKPGVDVRSGVSADGDNAGDIQVIQGSFAYTAPDGTPISLTYVADENGFHPEGAHLPTPPPIPEAIQRALSLLPDTTAQDSTSS